MREWRAERAAADGHVLPSFRRAGAVDTRARLRGGATLAVVGSLACSPVGNTFDNPNRTERAPRERIQTWKVEDVADNAVLGSGCLQSDAWSAPSVRASKGQHLLLEMRTWVVEKYYSDGTPGFWCGDEATAFRFMVSEVPNLACFDFPASGAASVLDWEPITLPTPRPPSGPTYMSGTGYRMWLEVDHTGLLRFIPNGTCGINGFSPLELQVP